MKTVVAIIVALTCTALKGRCAEPAPTAADDDPSRQALAAAVSRLIEGAIPLEYEKQKDWGATKNITVYRVDGKIFHTHVLKRERAVNHGVWKHYKLRMIEPEQNLHVELAELRPLALGRTAFTLNVDAKIDVWARAKVYEYGVHIIALEMEGDMRVRLSITGELGVEIHTGDAGTTLAIVPVVTNAKLDLDEFHLRRVSDAHGPVVHELGDGVRHLVEEELNGPRLTEKLNHAIEKKRDRLSFRPAELLENRWWPLGNWAPSPSPDAH